MKKLTLILVLFVVLFGQACKTVDTIKPTIQKPPVRFTLND